MVRVHIKAGSVEVEVETSAATELKALLDDAMRRARDLDNEAGPLARLNKRNVEP